MHSTSIPYILLYESFLLG
jgi:hypothetical protein